MKSFKIETDAAGRNYATLSRDQVSKNIRVHGLRTLKAEKNKPECIPEPEDENGGYKGFKGDMLPEFFKVR